MDSKEHPLYRRDPDATRLGQRILGAAAELYAQHGLEWVTFRKLALEIDSTEASLYRYFHNKYQLLCYLVWRHWQKIRNELARWNRELPAGTRQSQLLLTLLPGLGQDRLNDDLHRLVPVFWTWYPTRGSTDEAACEPVISEYAEVVVQAGLALEGLSVEYSQRLAHMLCQTASCLALFEQLPGFEISTYRLLWEGLLKDPAQGITPETATSLGLDQAAAWMGSGIGPPAGLPAKQTVAALSDDEQYDDSDPPVPAAEQSELTDPLNLTEGLPSEAAAAEPESPRVTQVMVRKRGGYNLLALREFMNLPRSEQEQLLLERKVHFISGEGEPIEVMSAIRQLFPAGLRSRTPR